MKNTFIIKLLSLLITVSLILTVFAGCETEDFTLYFGIDTMPATLDPQIASTYSELLTVKNCFRGLMKLDENGNAVNDICKSFTVSDDALTYSFLLDDSEWSNGDKVTADDFVYAFERASMPETEAPHINLLSNIESVFESDAKTVKFRLKAPDENFLVKLTDSVFMPCNRVFFGRSNGKYGLEKKYTVFNGNYTVSSVGNTYLILKRVLESDPEISQANRIYLTMSATGKNAIQRIIDKEIGITIDKVNDPAKIDRSLYTVNTAYDVNYAIVFNPNSEIGQNEGISKALAMSVHRELITIRMAERFKTVYTVIPEVCSVGNKSIGELSLNDEFLTEYDTDAARELYLTSQKSLKKGKLGAFNVLTVNNDELRTVVTNAINDWQSALGAYVNVETVSTDTSLLNTIRKGNYTAAFVPFSGNAENILSLLAAVDAEKYGEAYERFTASLDNAEAERIFREVSAGLAENDLIIPIISTPTSYIYDATYKNIYFDEGTGLVDFSIIYK